MEHYEKLIRMYKSGRIHQHFPEMDMELGEGYCRIITQTTNSYHHAADGAHGLVYFKFMDEAGYFAAATLEKEYFLLTKSMRMDFIRPIDSGEIIAEGNFLRKQGRIYHAEAKLFHKGKLCAASELELVGSRKLLIEVNGYDSSAQ